MTKMKKFLILMLLMLVLTIPIQSNTGMTNKTNSAPISDSRRTSDLSESGPVLIDSILDFSTWNGSGTAEEPYVMESMRITSTDETPCIRIKDVPDVYYEIRYCEISGSIYEGSGQHVGIDPVGSAIYIESGHATIVECTISNSSVGISLKGGASDLIDNDISGIEKGVYIESDNTNLSGNEISVEKDRCIDMAYGENITVTSCTLRTLGAFEISTGIYADNVALLNITDCSFGGLDIIIGDDAIVDSTFITSSTDIMSINVGPYCIGACFISSNGIIGRPDLGLKGYWGIYVFDVAAAVVLESNSIQDCGKGIQTMSDSTAIVQNAVENCTIGIALDGYYNIVRNNTITGNEKGIVVTGENNWIFYNIFQSNILSAVDNGLNNIWDDAIQLGNFYDDFPSTHSGQYHVNGTAGSIDRWPVYIGAPENGIGLLVIGIIALAVFSVVTGAVFIFAKRR